MRRITDFMLLRFPYFIALYFLCHLILRIVSNNTLTIDESEQMMLAQQFSFGYNSQPPLYTWIQILFFKIFGVSIFAIAVLKNSFLFLLYLFTYLGAKEVTRDKSVSALCSISMALLFQIAWVAQIDQIHSVAVTTSAAATLYIFLRIAKGQKTIDYFFLGIACGCGFLFKYNFLLLILSMLLVSLVTSDLRQKVFTPKIVISIATALLIIIPHGVWFFQNTTLATVETIDRMHFDQTGNPFINSAYGILDLLIANIAFISPFWIIFLAFFRKDLQPDQYFQKNWLARIYVSIFLMLLLIIVMSGTTNIKERWLQPYLFFFPFWAILHVKSSALGIKAGNFALTAAFFMVVVIIIIPIRLVTIDLSGKPHRENFPFEKLSVKIKDKGFDKGLIIAENMFIGGNLRLFFDNAQALAPSISNLNHQQQNAVLYVWNDKKPVFVPPEINMTDYNCLEFKEKIPYKFSKSLVYKPRYAICTK